MTKAAKQGETTPALLAQDYTLLNGRAVRLTMPDLFTMASGKADIPNEAQADVWWLLRNSNEPVPPAQQLLADQRYMRGLFYTAQLVLTPRLRLEDDEEGEIDRRELALSDLLVCFSFFRYGPSTFVSAPTDQNSAADQGSGGADTDIPV